MASVTCERASRIHPGSEKFAVDSLDLPIADGEFLFSPSTRRRLPT